MRLTRRGEIALVLALIIAVGIVIALGMWSAQWVVVPAH